MVNKKPYAIGRFGVFHPGLHNAQITQHGISLKYAGRRLPGLTRAKTGLLKKRYYPYFNSERAVDTGVRLDLGVGLKWSPRVPLKMVGSKSSSMERRIGRGMKRGNVLSSQVAIMVTMICVYHIPLEHFTASYRETRKPKVVTAKHVERNYFASIKDPAEMEAMTKACVSLMNSKMPHLPLLAQKLKELGIEVDGYEVPSCHPGVGMTGADLTGVHRPTGSRVVMELKTNQTAGYLFHTDGKLMPPFSHLPSCVMSHWYLQLSHTLDWFRRTCPQEAPKLCNPLLIRLTPLGAFHHVLPACFRSVPALG